MTREVTIRINAQDNASPVFKKIGGEATAATATIEQSNQRAARSYDDLQKRAAAVGAGLGTVIGGLALAGKAAVDHERQIDALNRVYGESSRQILDFTRALQESTNFSDEQARQAALTASTLQRSYGLATEAVEKLIERSADLAAVYGITLEDAVSRTSAAVRGEAEAAELLGITLNDNYVAAQAAARGLTGWSTSMTDAERAAFRYTLLLEQTASLQGAAADQASGARGAIIDLMHSVQDAGVAFGKWTGPMGEALSTLSSMALVLPVVAGGVGRLAGAVGGGSTLGALSLLVGSGIYAYNLNQQGSSTESATAGVLADVAGFLKKYTPGSYGDALFEDIRQQFIGIINENDFSKAARAVLLQPNESNPDILYRRLEYLFGLAPGQMTPEQVRKMIENQAKLYGYQSVGQYILETASNNANFVQDPTTGRIIPRDVYWETQYQRTKARSKDIANAATTYVGTPTTDMLARAAVPPVPNYSGSPGDSGLSAAAGFTPHFVTEAEELKKYREELQKTYGAYAGMIEGMNSAHDAQTAFAATQNILIEQQSVYSGQQSEYQGQLNALEAAYDVLQKRQAEGVQLTEEEQALLDNYPELYGRLEGGVEDAIVAQGLLAAQYAENMKRGDELNRTLENNTEATGDLVRIVEDLILSLDGIPDEVKTGILLERADESIADLINYYNWLNSIPGNVTTVVETIFVQGSGGVAGHQRGAMHGTTVAYADGGTVYGPILPAFANGGTWALVGERGPELVWLSRGDQVVNTEATRARLTDRRPGGGFVNNGVLFVTENTPDLHAAMMGSVLAGAR